MRIMRRWVPALIWAILIFIGSSIPGHQLPGQVSIASRFLHVAEYSVFGFLLVRAVAGSTSQTYGTRAFLLSCVMGIVYGLTDEFHQSFVPGREADRIDVIADAAGTVIGAAAGVVWKKMRNIV